MIRSWVVLVLSLGYVAFLFGIAYHGDRLAKRRGRHSAKPNIYALSLAVYCTSWTFYGSVGLAARTGYDFLPIYIGPILLFGVGWSLLVRVIRISKAHNITSIADFIAARYGKSQALAATVTIIAVIGTLPYIALQLKAVATSFVALTGQPEMVIQAVGHNQPFWSDTALAVSMILALFAILFGARHIDATEHHEGMILAIAFESLVKLGAFLAVGIFVTWGMFGGLGDLATRITTGAETRRLFLAGADGSTWVAMTGLAFVAMLCLPRQFHVTVVENASEQELRRAVWLFPLYLVAINAFVIPISAAGLFVFPHGEVDADMFVLALPIAAGQNTIAMFAFVGGLSAATGMVIVASVAVSTMVSNDLVMPVLLHGRWFGLAERGDMSAIVLHVRRTAIIILMLLACGFYRLVGNSFALASIGLLSFSVMAQFAPPLLGGLVWRGATAKGAQAGIIAGCAVWTYTLLLPALVGSGWIPQRLLDDGPFGIALLRPEQLLGLRFGPLTHGVFWSLLANATCYVVFSLSRVPAIVEQSQANAFVDFDRGHGQSGMWPWGGSITVSALIAVVAQYLGAERARSSFAELARYRGTEFVQSAPADFALVRHT
jgi:Na+/proline symporter